MSLKIRAQEKIERAGISNYAFDNEQLILCGVRYAINPCTCGVAACDGVQLQRILNIPSQTLQ